MGKELGMLGIQHHREGTGSGLVGFPNHSGIKFRRIQPQGMVKACPLMHDKGVGGKHR